MNATETSPNLHELLQNVNIDCIDKISLDWDASHRSV